MNFMLNYYVTNQLDSGTHWYLLKLEQQESLRSESTLRCPMITHTIDSYHIPSQKKTKPKLQIKKKNAKTSSFKILHITLHVTHLLKLLIKMCEYERDLPSIVEVIYSSSFGIKHKPTHSLNTWRHIHQIQQVSLGPSFSTILAIVFIQLQRGWNAHCISKNKMSTMVVQWELCGMNFCENIANLWVCNGKMTGLLMCCLSSTLGSRANDYVKTLAKLGFWLHHLPCSLGCWTNITLAARSLSPNQTGQNY